MSLFLDFVTPHWLFTHDDFPPTPPPYACSLIEMRRFLHFHIALTARPVLLSILKAIGIKATSFAEVQIIDSSSEALLLLMLQHCYSFCHHRTRNEFKFNMFIPRRNITMECTASNVHTSGGASVLYGPTCHLNNSVLRHNKVPAVARTIPTVCLHGNNHNTAIG